MAYIKTKSSKKEVELAKRQADARRIIEIRRELLELGLHPSQDAHLFTRSDGGRYEPMTSPPFLT